MMRRLRYVLLAVAVAVIAVPAALGLGAVVPRGGAPSPEGEGGPVTILLLANAIHTDIVLPVTPDLRRRFGFLGKDGLPIGRSDVAGLVVGWGGRAFYTQTPTWADLSFWPAAKSLTLDRSVMHVALAGAIDRSAPDVRCVALGARSYERLLKFIEAGFERAPDGEPVEIENAGYTPFDRFYEAVGWFNVLVGCNTFTAAALRSAGLTTGLWTPLPATLFLSLDLYGPAPC